MSSVADDEIPIEDAASEPAARETGTPAGQYVRYGDFVRVRAEVADSPGSGIVGIAYLEVLEHRTGRDHEGIALAEAEAGPILVLVKGPGVQIQLDGGDFREPSMAAAGTVQSPSIR